MRVPDAPDRDLSTLSDRALVQRARAGDPDAFGVLYERHYAAIYRVCQRYSTEHAADLTHDAFVKAIEHLGAAWENTNFLAWLYRIAINLGLDYRRLSSTRAERPVGLAADDSDIGDASFLLQRTEEHPVDARLLAEERMALLDDLLSEVDPRDATAFRLQAKGWTLKDVARHLVVPYTALKPRLFRLRATLSERIATDPERYGPLDTDRAARSFERKLSTYHRKRGRDLAPLPPLSEGDSRDG